MATRSYGDLEWDQLPDEVRDFFAITGNAKFALSMIEWGKFCPEAELFYEGGVPKFRGILVGAQAPDGKIHFRQTGDLHNPEKSDLTVRNKFGILNDSTGIIQSLEGRSPENGFWGGAARGAGRFAVWNFGITGLPELGDDISVTLGLEKAEIIAKADVAVRYNANGILVPEARKLVGMSEAGYVELGREINEAMEAAAELTFS